VNVLEVEWLSKQRWLAKIAAVFAEHAVTIASDPQQVLALQRTWAEMEIDVPLVVVDSPYREFTRPALEYIRSLKPGPDHTVTVIIPEFVVEHWWENILHNQNALRLKAALLSVRWVVVISIPFHVGEADDDDEFPGNTLD